MNWIGGIIVVFIWAAFVNPDTAPYIGAVTAILMLIFLIVGAVKLTKSFKKNREKKREEKIKEQMRQEYLAEQATIKAELYPRLNEAFTPILAYQQSLNNKLFNWLKNEFNNTDKPEYQAHLQKYIDTFRPIPPSDCNSDFLDVVKAPGESVAVLAIGNYVIEPVELLDKSNWEKHIGFLLCRVVHEGKGEFYLSSVARLEEIETIKKFIEIKLADALKSNHLAAATTALGLPDDLAEEFIENVKSEAAEHIQIVGSDDNCARYAFSADKNSHRREAYG